MRLGAKGQGSLPPDRRKQRLTPEDEEGLAQSGNEEEGAALPCCDLGHRTAPLKHPLVTDGKLRQEEGQQAVTSLPDSSL